VSGFIGHDDVKLEQVRTEMGLAMNLDDLRLARDHFRDHEHRDPTVTEIRLLDTYWSDHCRHTTFLTRIEEVEIDGTEAAAPLREAWHAYLAARQRVYGTTERPITLMDIALMGMRQLRQRGQLPDLEESEEINAASIHVMAQRDDNSEPWLLMFKNETHNHPTEIEPYGGASTCLGGAIRDPLSGRAYVYQSMRVTGSGDPRAPLASTRPGKLPQRKITLEAAHGFSAYGNQIGLATGQVNEIYDEGYVAKRMEIGAVVGAAPAAQVVRGSPAPGDAVYLVGGRTGRDGIGGATGSSKPHSEASLQACAAEVQKGNPPVERMLQRFFRHPEVAGMIKRCNDFGAGGVAVAIGELTPGLVIDLDLVPRKYDGLDGTELAISESQERMAVVVSRGDGPRFAALAAAENLEATAVAQVVPGRRLRMTWRARSVVDIDRELLDSQGAPRHARALLAAPDPAASPWRGVAPADLETAWHAALADLSACSQQGLSERFDSSIGGSTVLSPFGGRFQATPAEGMAAKLPMVGSDTVTGSAMAFGFDPRLARWSPFHGGLYAVIEALARLAACGAPWRSARLTLQEYFERLGNDPLRWGKPLAALLGAFLAQERLGTAAIGGKDSMSGSFHDLDVPPTLVAFAVAPLDVRHAVSPEFKAAGAPVVQLRLERDKNELPDFTILAANLDRLNQLVCSGLVKAASVVCAGGLATTVSRMAFGNRVGLTFAAHTPAVDLFRPEIGSLVLELTPDADPQTLLAGTSWRLLGRTTGPAEIRVDDLVLPLAELEKSWRAPLEPIFPTVPEETENGTFPATQPFFASRRPVRPGKKTSRPRVLLTVFPGTNCEYDTERAFARAGAACDTLVFCNLTPQALDESIAELARRIRKAQIVAIPGGFSAGDEPEGSAKFIAAAFRNAAVAAALTALLEKRDGLLLGVCNGFQALLKLGLLPGGRITNIGSDSSTLTYNTIGRHVARLVHTRVTSVLSPWFSLCRPGDQHIIPVSHGEGRFVAPEATVRDLFKTGQVAAQYVDLEGTPTMDPAFNPNGSLAAVEALTSPDGRILGKMAHSERVTPNTFINIPGIEPQPIFESGVNYFA
jgi:phosphoribosylformylglycinamidine synthase